MSHLSQTKVSPPTHEQNTTPQELCLKGQRSWSLSLSPLVPLGDQVLDVGIQLIICVDVYVLE